MIFSILPILLLLAPSALTAATPYRYFLRAKPLSASTSTSSTKTDLVQTPLYLSSSITINGHTNYVLLAPSSSAAPLTISQGDGSITLDTSKVIGASSEAPLYLANADSLNSVYKQVILGDQMAGKYTKGFTIDVGAEDANSTGRLGLSKEGFGGFVACTAAKGIKQVYWYDSTSDGEGGMPVVCEEVEFERVWYANETVA